MSEQNNNGKPEEQQNTAPKPDEATPAGEPAAQGKGKKPKKEKKKKTVGQEILSWVLTLVAAVVIAGLVRALLIEPVRVQGGSMDTTLVNGEVMLVTKPEVLLGRLERGDVIICRYPGRSNSTTMRLGAPLDMSLTSHTLFVKRLMGLPGDTIEVRDGHVYLDGQMLDEPYIDNDKWGGRPFGPYTLGDNEYFVIGDNRASSHDSRYPEVGPITGDMIVGHPKLVVLPLNRIRTIK